MSRVLLSLAAVALLPAPAEAPGSSNNVVEPAKKERCQTIRCQRRVSRRLRRKRERVEMRSYKARPLPWCTWGPESGRHRPEWSLARYRQPNVSGGSGGGKFQIVMETWFAFGGAVYSWSPVVARPVVQERVARRIARDGLQHWVNC